MGTQVSQSLLSQVLDSSNVSCERTGVGYFLTTSHPDLPSERFVLSEPRVIGRLGSIEVGYVCYVQDHELALECHGWGTTVPLDIRSLPATAVVMRDA